tara:strand:+ start:10283 stop:10732 length:450 start_codon:yes stop_codon:yes gene_type:complete
VTITERVYLKNHSQICAQMGVRVPKKVFSGATLDLLFTGEIEKIDQAFRPYIYAFAKDFLDCDCESNPYCEHPERKFMKYILRLRGEKRSPKEIVKKMEEDYMIYAYPSDLVTFLDDSIRTLEVLEAMADTMGDIEKKDQIRKEKELLI